MKILKIPEKHCGIINNKEVLKYLNVFMATKLGPNINIKEMLKTFNYWNWIIIIRTKNKNVSVFLTRKN